MRRKDTSSVPEDALTESHMPSLEDGMLSWKAPGCPREASDGLPQGNLKAIWEKSTEFLAIRSRVVSACLCFSSFVYTLVITFCFLLPLKPTLLRRKHPNIQRLMKTVKSPASNSGVGRKQILWNLDGASLAPRSWSICSPKCLLNYCQRQCAIFMYVHA